MNGDEVSGTECGMLGTTGVAREKHITQIYK